MTTTTDACNRAVKTMSNDSNYNQQELFLSAVNQRDIYELQRILKRWDINVNVFDQEGQTPLHQSCMDGNLELVKLLVKFGADVRLANRDGWSALHIAAYAGHAEIAVYLIAQSQRSKILSQF